MAAKKESENAGIYLDSSAFAKLYVPEPESARLDHFLRGRTDVMISELSITEVISAVARRQREGVLDAENAHAIRDTLLSDARSGLFRTLDLSPAVHREAERMLLSTLTVSLRTLDALHIALALSGRARRVVTYDNRMSEATVLHGLQVVQL